MTVRIAPLADADPNAIEALLDAAFGAGRHARTAYRIRAGQGFIAELSFAAVDRETLVGSLQSWPVAVGATPTVLVGPVAVTPELQNAGIGRAMMEALITAAPDLPMVIIGDAEYYRRYGFTDAATAHWDVPGPVERHRLLARHGNRLPSTGHLGPRAFALASRTA